MSNGLINRQYVGARYVPKIMGEWNKALQYEALSVVTYMNNSFTSKIPVPANVDITNKDYWVNTGNYNAQVENYRKETEDVNKNTQPAIKYTELQTHKRYLIISDSYGLGRNNTIAWTTYLKQLLNITNENDYYTFSEGSMGFNRTGENGNTVLTLLQKHISEIYEINSITDVIFALGANDILATYGLENAINNCINYTKLNFINANIHIGFIGNILEKNQLTLKNYMQALIAYESTATALNCSYISGVSYIMHNAQLVQNDGVHPTSNGSLEIAKFIACYLKKESPIYKAFSINTMTSDYFKNSYIQQSIDNGIATMSIFLGSTTDNVLTFTDRSYIEIGTINEPIIRGVGGAPINFTVSTFIKDTLNTITLMCYICDGKIYATANYNTSISISPNVITTANTASSSVSMI